MIAKAGTLLVITEGCYSDFWMQGFYVVLKDFDPSEIKKNVEALNKGINIVNHTNYVATLLQLGLLLEIQYSEIHVGDYSNFDGFYFTPIKNE